MAHSMLDANYDKEFEEKQQQLILVIKFKVINENEIYPNSFPKEAMMVVTPQVEIFLGNGEIE